MLLAVVSAVDLDLPLYRRLERDLSLVQVEELDVVDVQVLVEVLSGNP